MPGPGWYLIGDEEKKEVLDVLDSRLLTRYRFDSQNLQRQPKVYQFEREFEKYLSVKHCLGTNSCSSSLLAGLMALGIGPGDEVIVPGYTFVASVASIVYARAVPVLAEIDDSLTIDPDDVIKKISDRTKAIIVVHMLGAPCNMDRILEIAKARGLFVIEDVAQACGGSYHGRKLGSIGDFGAFSLNIFKTITSGDGGVLATNNEKLYNTAFAIHDHGFTPSGLGVADGSSILGLNLRMHELAGAIALAQLRRLNPIMERLRRLRDLFKEGISDLGLSFRRSNDETGDCATTLTLIFDTSARAKFVAQRLGTTTLNGTGKYNYLNFIMSLESRPFKKGCPFLCESFPYRQDSQVVMLPRTDDILSRSLAISIGVSDTYLGTGFGIDILADENTVMDKVKAFKELTRPLTPTV